MASCVQSELGSDRQENPFDAVECAANEYREAVQCWKDGLTVHWHSPAKNYAEGRCALVFDLNLLFIGRDSRHVSRNGGPVRKREYLARFVFVADIPNKLELQMGNQQPVFVFNVETVNGPDGVPIPSLVRLYDIHNEVDDPVGGLLYQSTIDGTYKFISGRAHRKVGVASSLPCGSKFNVADSKVESTSEIMQSVSGDAHEYTRHPFSRNELQEVVASTRIVLDLNFVRVTFLELPDLNIQIVDVFTGPLNL